MVCGIISADPGGYVSNQHHNIDSPIFDANMTWNLLINSVLPIYFSTKVIEEKSKNEDKSICHVLVCRSCFYMKIKMGGETVLAVCSLE